MKEKGKREREKNLSRKKRRKLEAAREMLEDEGDDDKLEVKGANKKEKGGLSLVDVTYRRAKAVKAVKKAMDSGKIVKKNKKNTARNKSVACLSHSELPRSERCLLTRLQNSILHKFAFIARRSCGTCGRPE
ncbi:DEAD-box ATP-dependent RNA helicase [Arachis hypogaea]|nr:DEAD-box ATP-dependent RNA helicase [Arachis hypogaea]